MTYPKQPIDYNEPKWQLARLLSEEFNRYYIHYGKIFAPKTQTTCAEFENIRLETQFAYWELADDLLSHKSSELSALIESLKEDTQ